MDERPIDANAFLRFLQIEEYIMDDEEITFDYIRSLIKAAPTIEAKPVIHAHWEEVREGRHICSNCKVKASLTSDEYDYIEDLSDYCPSCGAQMDEVAE